MVKQSQLEKLTHLQLMQKVIHLESEVERMQMKKDDGDKQSRKQVKILARENKRLKDQLRGIEELRREGKHEVERRAFYGNPQSHSHENVSEENLIQQLKNRQAENIGLQEVIRELRNEVMIQKEREKDLLDKLEQTKNELQLMRTFDQNELLVECNRLKEEQNHLQQLNQSYEETIKKLKEENQAFQERLTLLVEHKSADEKRLDKMNDNLNEVFKETKQLVKMSSSLEKQLEKKVLELAQLKKVNQLLVDQIGQLQNQYEESEIRNKELELTVEKLKEDFKLTQQLLSSIQDFEEENRQLKSNLEEAMKEIMQLSEKYEEDKKVYLDDLILIQEEVSKYKGTHSLTKQQMDWFHRIRTLQNHKPQASNQKHEPTNVPVDFFTLKEKTRKP